jgi:hypothetical protein
MQANNTMPEQAHQGPEGAPLPHERKRLATPAQKKRAPSSHIPHAASQRHGSRHKPDPKPAASSHARTRGSHASGSASQTGHKSQRRPEGTRRRHYQGAPVVLGHPPPGYQWHRIGDTLWAEPYEGNEADMDPQALNPTAWNVGPPVSNTRDKQLARMAGHRGARGGIAKAGAHLGSPHKPRPHTAKSRTPAKHAGSHRGHRPGGVHHVLSDTSFEGRSSSSPSSGHAHVPSIHPVAPHRHYPQR